MSTCAHCGADVVGATTCPSCGSPVVDPEQIESLLARPAEPMPDEPLAEETGEFRPLAVTAEIVSEQFLDSERSAGESVEAGGGSGPEAGGSEQAPPPPLPPPPPSSSPPAEPLAPPVSAPPADPEPPRPVWGPREHPPAVLAPPPPEPLEAPAVATVKRPTGTGLPPAGSATAPPVPTAVPAAPTAAPAGGDPANRQGKRRRGWFGRGRDAEEPEVAPPPAPAEPSSPPGEPSEDGSFPGAPEGLLDGVAAEERIGADQRDPAGLDDAMARVSAGARRLAQAPLLVVAALLEEGEVAEAAVQGSYQDRNAVVVLTDRRVLVANDRPWAPDVRRFPLEPGLTVHGWQDERKAALVFVRDGLGVHVDAISDRPLARDLAQRVRARCGGEAPAGAAD